MGNSVLIWILFGWCLALSFLLSGMESGVFALSRLRVRQRLRQGNPSAKVLHEYLENPESFLWTILVGNTMANLLIFGWVALQLRALTSPHAVWFALGYTLVVILFYTVFDLLPKMLFRTYPNRLCLMMARPFRLIDWVLSPLVAVVESAAQLLMRWRGGAAFTWRLFGNREELRLLMQESSQALSSEERIMINRVMDLQSMTVRQIMRPWAEAVKIDAASPVAEALVLSRGRALTRLPVIDVREGRPRAIGLFSLNTVLYGTDYEQKPVREVVRPALYLEQDLRLEIALRRMQRSGQRLAIVVGPKSQEVGIVSLQDVLRTMFGEVSL